MHLGVVCAVLLGASIENHSENPLSRTFMIGLIFSALNIIPLFICFILDKTLNKVEDEDIGILRTSVRIN